MKHSDVLLHHNWLQAMYQSYCKENGIVFEDPIERLDIEIVDPLVEASFLSKDMAITDREFGYACYEYYRQSIKPNFFDRLLLSSADNRTRILDLCCGAGATVYTLLRQKPQIERIYGIDINSKQIQLLQAVLQKMPRLGQKAIAEAGDAHHLSVPDQFFDLVICRVALQYLEYKQVIREIYRKLSSGGSVFLLVHGSGYILDYLWNRKGIFSKQLYRYLFHPSASPGQNNSNKARCLSIGGLKRALYKEGFTQVAVHTSSEYMRLAKFPVYFAITAVKE